VTAVCVTVVKLEMLTDMEPASGPDEPLKVTLDLYQLEDGF